MIFEEPNNFDRCNLLMKHLFTFFPETSENEPGGLSSGRNLDIITKKAKNAGNDLDFKKAAQESLT